MFRDTVRTVLCEQQESMDPTAVLDFLTACIHIPRLWQVSNRNLSLTSVLWIRIRMDPYHFGNLDPHQTKIRIRSPSPLPPWPTHPTFINYYNVNVSKVVHQSLNCDFGPQAENRGPNLVALLKSRLTPPIVTLFTPFLIR
jgi:hypothetical protein